MLNIFDCVTHWKCLENDGEKTKTTRKKLKTLPYAPIHTNKIHEKWIRKKVDGAGKIQMEQTIQNKTKRRRKSCQYKWMWMSNAMNSGHMHSLSALLAFLYDLVIKNACEDWKEKIWHAMRTGGKSILKGCNRCSRFIGRMVFFLMFFHFFPFLSFLYEDNTQFVFI